MPAASDCIDDKKDEGERDVAGFWSEVLSSLVWLILALVFCGIGYKFFDWITPWDLNKELAEDQNTAVGVSMAGIFIAIGLIVAALIR